MELRTLQNCVSSLLMLQQCSLYEAYACCGAHGVTYNYDRGGCKYILIVILILGVTVILKLGNNYQL